MAYDGENLYLSIPEPEYEPEYDPEYEPEYEPDETDEDRYLFPPLWLVGKTKQEDQHESL